MQKEVLDVDAVEAREDHTVVRVGQVVGVGEDHTAARVGEGKARKGSRSSMAKVCGT